MKKEKTALKTYNMLMDCFFHKKGCLAQPMALDLYSMGVRLVNSLNWLLKALLELNPT